VVCQLSGNKMESSINVEISSVRDVSQYSTSRNRDSFDITLKTEDRRAVVRLVSLQTMCRWTPLDVVRFQNIEDCTGGAAVCCE
jgi:hypothetical protein